MAPEKDIFPDQIHQVEEGIRGLGGRVVSSDLGGRGKVWEMDGNELVRISISASGRSAIVATGQSGAEVLEKAGVIDFSRPESIQAVEASRSGLQKA